MLRWLQEFGQGNFARHEAEAFDGEALGVHFRRIEDALDFLAFCPEVRFADNTDTRSCRTLVRMKRA